MEVRREVTKAFAQAYCVGPSWQDCGAVGELGRQVGTSHFEQAVSESPSRSDAMIANGRVMRTRARRPPSAPKPVCILKNPAPHAPI